MKGSEGVESLPGRKRQSFYSELIVGLFHFMTCTSFQRVPAVLQAGARQGGDEEDKGETMSASGVRGNNCRKPDPI